MRGQEDMRYAARTMEEARQREREEKKRERAARSTGAHTTEPIKDLAMLKKWMEVAREHDKRMKRGGVSWYLLLLIGFNTSLRIGDLCKLKVGDVKGRQRVQIIAQKTGKMSDIMLRENARAKIEAMLRDRGKDEYVLMSRQRDGRTGKMKPISRQRAFEIVKEIARRAEFPGRAGCHTMRKTFAYQCYKATNDLSLVQKALNHSSQAETLRYIGLDQQAMDEAMLKMPDMV